MSALSTAAHRWIASRTTPGAQVTPVDGGIAAARRTGVSHHLADAVEVTVDGETTLAAKWLCGGSSVDAVLLDEESVACVGCRLAAAMPHGPCVYYAWDAEDELLYIGSSLNVSQRVRGHMGSTPWWPEVRRLTFDEYTTGHVARRAEMEAIAARPGRYNREGVRPTKAARALDLIIGGESA